MIFILRNNRQEIHIHVIVNMVRAQLLYGVELALGEFYAIVSKIDSVKLVSLKIHTLNDFISKYSVTHDDIENETDYDKRESLDDLVNYINRKLSTEKSCKFYLNSACCCINDGMYIFLGWRSDDAWSLGRYSQRVKNISHKEKDKVNIFVNNYTDSKPKFYLATSACGCDFCT